MVAQGLVVVEGAIDQAGELLVQVQYLCMTERVTFHSHINC